MEIRWELRDVAVCTNKTDNRVRCPALMATTKQKSEGAQSVHAHTVRRGLFRLT